MGTRLETDGQSHNSIEGWAVKFLRGDKCGLRVKDAVAGSPLHKRRSMPVLKGR